MDRAALVHTVRPCDHKSCRLPAGCSVIWNLQPDVESVERVLRHKLAQHEMAYVGITEWPYWRMVGGVSPRGNEVPGHFPRFSKMTVCFCCSREHAQILETYLVDKYFGKLYNRAQGGGGVSSMVNSFFFVYVAWP